MIGKDALIQAIRIASGGGGGVVDPDDLRLHWNVDDSDLVYNFSEPTTLISSMVTTPLVASTLDRSVASVEATPYANPTASRVVTSVEFIGVV